MERSTLLIYFLTFYKMFGGWLAPASPGAGQRSLSGAAAAVT